MVGDRPGMFCATSFFLVPPPCICSHVDSLISLKSPSWPLLAMTAASLASPLAEQWPLELGISPILAKSLSHRLKLAREKVLLSSHGSDGRGFEIYVKRVLILASSVV